MFKFGGREVRVVAASGALGDDGRGYWWERLLIWLGLIRPEDFDLIITKTLTRQPREGNWRWYNPWHCFRFLKEGTVNAIGLANPGIDWWLDKVAPNIDSAKTPLVVSLSGSPLELAQMVRVLERFNLAGVEINVSCPNVTDNPTTAEEIVACCQAVADYTKLPILLKLSIATPQIRKIICGAKKMIAGISINSAPWDLLFPRQPSPLAHLGGGGVSGKIAQPCTWALVKSLRAQMFYLKINIPIIAPSVWCERDIKKVRNLLGPAAAISFASLFLCHPGRPAKLVAWVRRTKCL